MTRSNWTRAIPLLGIAVALALYFGADHASARATPKPPKWQWPPRATDIVNLSGIQDLTTSPTPPIFQVPAGRWFVITSAVIYQHVVTGTPQTYYQGVMELGNNSSVEVVELLGGNVHSVIPRALLGASPNTPFSPFDAGFQHEVGFAFHPGSSVAFTSAFAPASGFRYAISGYLSPE